MDYTWDTYLETGFAHIDRQHKMLFEVLCSLNNACKSMTPADELERTLDFLTSYTFKHFSDEEQIQRTYDYPDYLQHKRYHDHFSDVVREHCEQLRRKGYSHQLMYTVYDTVGDWLVHHIRGEDFRMAAHVIYLGAESISAPGVWTADM